jgi:hypothetical protein
MHVPVLLAPFPWYSTRVTRVNCVANIDRIDKPINPTLELSFADAIADKRVLDSPGLLVLTTLPWGFMIINLAKRTIRRGKRG